MSNYGGTDDESAEIRKFNAEVVSIEYISLLYCIIHSAY